MSSPLLSPLPGLGKPPTRAAVPARARPPTSGLTSASGLQPFKPNPALYVNEGLAYEPGVNAKPIEAKQIRSDLALGDVADELGRDNADVAHASLTTSRIGARLERGLPQARRDANRGTANYPHAQHDAHSQLAEAYDPRTDGRRAMRDGRVAAGEAHVSDRFNLPASPRAPRSSRNRASATSGHIDERPDTSRIGASDIFNPAPQRAIPRGGAAGTNQRHRGTATTKRSEGAAASKTSQSGEASTSMEASFASGAEPVSLRPTPRHHVVIPQAEGGSGRALYESVEEKLEGDQPVDRRPGDVVLAFDSSTGFAYSA